MAYSTVPEGPDTLLRKQINALKSIEEQLECVFGVGVFAEHGSPTRYTRASGKRY